MKIYTRHGDDGTTGLLGGTRLHKHHLRIEAYGTVDELNSFTGLLRDFCGEPHRQHLITIQEELFTIGSHLAADPVKNKMALPEIDPSWIARLERSMDEMEEVLPEMRFFVLPGGHQHVSTAHVCRCVCRRAERLCVALAETEPVESVILQYMNRLSDYFFVLARKLSHELQVEEVPWNPKKRS